MHKFYLIILLLYFFQAFLPQGMRSVGAILIALMMLINVWYFVKNTFDGNRFPQLVNLFLLMAFIFTAYFLLSPQNILGFRTLNFYKNVVFNLLTPVAFYCWATKGVLTTKFMRRFIVVLLALTAMHFFYNRVLVAAELDREIDAVTNNVGYVFVFTVPLIVQHFWEDKSKMLLLLAVVVAFVLASVKRGAMVVLTAQCLVIAYYYIKEKRPGQRFGRIFVVAAIFVVVGALAYNFIESSEYFQRRIASTLEGKYSNREWMYAKIWLCWLNDYGPLQKLMGGGLNASIRITQENYAHNDWLELLSSLGLLGVFLYGACFVFINRLRKRVATVGAHKVVVTLVLVTCFITVLFSMMLYSLNMNFVMMALAIELSNHYNSSSKSNFHAIQRHKAALP